MKKTTQKHKKTFNSEIFSLPLPIAIIFLVIFVWICLYGVDFVKQQNIRTNTQNQQQNLDLDTATQTNPTNTFTDQTNTFRFLYQSNLKPLTYKNGVVTFLPETVFDDCVAYENTAHDRSVSPCEYASFNLSGFTFDPEKTFADYQQEKPQGVQLGTYTDKRGRTWNTTLLLGQSYNFEAFGEHNSRTFKVSFQYRLGEASAEEAYDFFTSILDDFVLLQ